MTFLFFILIVYGACFLYAEAKIFGCGAAAYQEDPSDEEYIRTVGTFKLRPHLLRFKFFREQMECYFCMGLWFGPILHVVLYFLLERSYFLHHEEPWKWFLSVPVAALLGAASALLTNALVDLVGALKGYLGALVTPQPVELLSEPLEESCGDSEDH